MAEVFRAVGDAAGGERRARQGGPGPGNGRGRRGPRVIGGALLAVLLALGPSGCTGAEESDAAAAPEAEGAGAGRRDREEPEGPLTVYVARAEPLLGPLLDDFADDHDVELEVRYGAPKELLDAVFAQVTTGPADVFLSSDAVTMGALSRRGLLRELPMDLVAMVPERFAAVEQRHDWVGLTARPRGIVYDRTRQRPEGLPRSLEALRDGAHRATFGVAPTSPSFVAQLAVYRVAKGEEALDELLGGIRDNQPKSYGSDSGVVQAVLRGEVGWGLVDLGLVARDLQAAPAGRLATAVLDQGELSGFVDASAGGVLSDDPRALDLLRFLLRTEVQQRLAGGTGEYPLAAGVEPPAGMPKLETLRTPPVDFADVAAVLDETQKAMRRVGLLK